MSQTELLSLLEQQTLMMNEFGEVESRLQQAILDHDWEEMGRITPELETLSAALEEHDRKRHVEADRVKAELGLRADCTFDEIAGKADASLRKRLTDAQRELQIAVLRVKSLTGGIDAYVRGSLRTANDVLGELFPEQKGTMYSRKGKRTPAAGHAIVLDHRL